MTSHQPVSSEPNTRRAPPSLPRHSMGLARDICGGRFSGEGKTSLSCGDYLPVRLGNTTKRSVLRHQMPTVSLYTSPRKGKVGHGRILSSPQRLHQVASFAARLATWCFFVSNRFEQDALTKVRLVYITFHLLSWLLADVVDRYRLIHTLGIHNNTLLGRK